MVVCLRGAMPGSFALCVRRTFGISGVILILGLAACAARPHFEPTSPSANTFWIPPAPSPTPSSEPEAKSAIPDSFKNRTWTLADVLELTLRNHPATRGAWADAQAAAANYEVQRAAYYPKINLEATAALKSTNDSRYAESWSQTSYGPAINLSWLLLDFGGRAAAVENATQLLITANWSQNAILQDTILAAEKAYFGYLAAKAAMDARRANLKDVELQLEGAIRRHDAGVATLADVLQARTAAAQAKLALQSAEGAVQTTRGALAASMGLSANLPFDTSEAPQEIPLDAVQQDVEALLAEALAKRPALAAAKASALASFAQVRQAEADGLPTLGLSAIGGNTWFDLSSSAPSGTEDHREDVYSAGLLVRFPLFTGFAQTATVQKTRAQAESSLEKVRGLEQQIALQVFSAYYGLKTASEKVRTVQELLSSATQSEEVARGRYAEGVGTIIEVITAQAALADARAQNVLARWDWFTNLAQLAHDTGLLGLHGETPLVPRFRSSATPAN